MCTHGKIIMKFLSFSRLSTALSTRILPLGMAATLLSTALSAQTLDPSVRLPQTAPTLSAPAVSPNFRVNGGPLLRAAPGGATFELRAIEISGNTLFSAEQLGALVADRTGTMVDFSILEEIANTLSQFYRDAGYPFARAYLPAQDVQNGEVEFEILEGRYGEISAVDAPAASPAMALQALRNQVLQESLGALSRHFKEEELQEVVRSIDNLFDGRMQQLETEYAQTDQQRTANPEAQAFLGELSSGEVIEAEKIERIALILDDIPGYTAVPVVRPGALRGAGDLEVRMIEDDATKVFAAVDNFGSEASGRNRARLDLFKSRNFLFGDLFSFTGLVTDENTWLASLGYSLPLNPKGLRLQTNYLFSRYELGSGEFAGLADGETERFSASLNYPLVRSQLRNITLSGGLEWSNYVNTLAASTEEYTIESLPLSVNFDWRDGFGGSAVTYGAISAQYNEVVDDNRASRSADDYAVFNLRIAREQRFNSQLSAVARLSLQQADDDIDSSHFISLGGMYAVRAYPPGEFSGYRGEVFQGELSYHLPQYDATPYLFFDAARADRVTTADLSESRDLSGYGLGLRFARLGANMDLVAAWIGEGGDSLAEPDMSSPRLWFSLSSSF